MSTFFIVCLSLYHGFFMYVLSSVFEICEQITGAEMAQISAECSCRRWVVAGSLCPCS